MKYTKTIVCALLAIAGAALVYSCTPKENEPERVSLKGTQWVCHSQKDHNYGYYSLRVYIDSDLKFTSNKEGTLFLDYFVDALDYNYNFGDTATLSLNYQLSPDGNGSFEEVTYVSSGETMRPMPFVYNADEQSINVTVTDSRLKQVGIDELLFSRVD